ncbi:UxaA family hydrolase [Stratiformator vulcanicus]|uniref:Altronate dehydratase n=1 Tax=Stratiformator vulcanicus TaxID=2527980 RepID=A0A517R5U6_9PLAN|nr:altronate dehydratase family protein [Stratiformator vulcanicus]QDT39267.1 Altronate dehydratase [Stratiformator vulcanicus]
MSAATATTATPRWLRVHPDDAVIVLIDELAEGESVDGVTARQTIPAGHKLATTCIDAGEHVLKYGYSIGIATQTIAIGDHVHTHNLKTGLDTNLEYRWSERTADSSTKLEPSTFEGFRRKDGRVAIRNEIWIINTVGCVNMTATKIGERATREFASKGLVDGVYSFPHPFGCSQLGDDLGQTQAILSGLIRHPNAAGVLVIGLGCENNQIKQQLERAGIEDPDRIRYFNAQEVDDEVEHGLQLVGELAEYASSFQRQTIPSNELIFAMKCGGSDGFSGITANPLVGRITDRHCATGGTTILSEVPEMFGAEQLLMDRTTDRETFDACGNLINEFKDYFRAHDQPVYDNPSPGNKDGGITTLEEKSLGCVQKGGRAPVKQVLAYGEPATPNLGGLALVNAPGNDAVSSTAMTAAGAHMVLFTTGRGTPLGVPAPTIKIATNADLASRKSSWIDFNAGRMVADGASAEELESELFDLLLKTASGEPARNEVNGYREIAVWKTGVTV